MAQLRVGNGTHQRLRMLAKSTGESMQAVLDKALEEYHRKQFFADFDSAFATLKSDPEAWQEELEERDLWANTLEDNLDADETKTGK
jgi:uncharacterized surface protein with fasciclin (FAS1) repeats